MKRYQIGKKVFISAALVMLSMPAYAYLDPGTGSIILQAIIASVVVGFASLRLWWDKFIGLFSARKNDKKLNPQNNETDEVGTDKEGKN
ncbi:hypothetical protein [Shewanella pealeana]|uniref:Uncharacterized protein n=1 Tax=Shewanella pealeana (strain ATCC 700345 / ANG-SQ1) TaxID=398579 RepID=A8H7Q1_SHEPA|nr:hypothetical protein [Shewanella pealeana]ABV88588.1 hypothetical protein Spea_3273 [Shewanella pealeana ATCC 700345]